LRQATRKRRENRAGSSIERVERTVEGWEVRVDIQLVEGFDEALGREALRVLEHKLREVRLLVPEKPLADLRRVPIILDREHPGLSAMQYHPSAAWLREHGYDPEMARCVHIPRAEELVTLHSVNRQPFAVLHELAHAYHDRVLGFEEARIMAAWRAFRESGRSENVLHASGRRQEHYGRKDAKEFFAEMTEAYFGVNDFYPFLRAELKETEPELDALLESVWGR
jgi:hypothetical protein